jgi:hypothetical protein
MHRILPPLCLLVALAMVVVGFGLWAVEPPEASVELHRARVAGDEAYREVLEAELARQQRNRNWLLGCLFAGAALFAVAAFVTMRPAGGGRKKG